MPNIKIFVSHRIDINSELVDNPIYTPVRCGAVFDQNNYAGIQGDDTGNNISEKRMSFCEFTVQYWAWKNAEADYFGLCHYRRYLSFAKKHFRTDAYNMIYVPILTDKNKCKFGLIDPEAMYQEISQYDIVVSEYAQVGNIPVPGGQQNTVSEMWKAHDGFFFEKKVIDLMFQLIDEYSPLYSKSAREYFSGSLHRGFNCYVMRKELFYRLCEFQFPIMFTLERQLDTTGYTQTMLRTPAFIGEMLYGIFLYHVTTYENWRTKEVQLIFFRDTEKNRGPWHCLKKYMWIQAERCLRAIAALILPKGTQRREAVKKFYYSVMSTRKDRV